MLGKNLCVLFLPLFSLPPAAMLCVAREVSVLSAYSRNLSWLCFMMPCASVLKQCRGSADEKLPSPSLRVSGTVGGGKVHLAIKHILAQISPWQNANCVTWGISLIVLNFCFLRRTMEIIVPP